MQMKFKLKLPAPIRYIRMRNGVPITGTLDWVGSFQKITLDSTNGDLSGLVFSSLSYGATFIESGSLNGKRCWCVQDPSGS